MQGAASAQKGGGKKNVYSDHVRRWGGREDLVRIYADPLTRCRSGGGKKKGGGGKV